MEPYVHVNSMFTVSITVTNLSETKREIRLILPAYEWSSVFQAVHPIDRHTIQLENKWKNDIALREAEMKVFILSKQFYNHLLFYSGKRNT